MKVAVITPYYKESEAVLRECHDSVLAQTVACDHFMIADGFPNPAVDGWAVEHITLPMSHRDVGNTPRVIGALSAFSAGYDAVSFLDADNWYKPDHVANMLALQRRTGAVVCTAGRSMHRPDGSFMFIDEKNDGRTHVDSNCYFLVRPAMSVMLAWATMPKELSPISDTVYLQSIRRARLSHAHDPHISVCYRSTWASDFERIGEVPPPDAKVLAFTDQPYDWLKSLSWSERRRIRRELGWPPGLAGKIARRLRAIGTRVAERVFGSQPAKRVEGTPQHRPA
ncbi:MAG: glycosyltransferase [Amaricoccus sp.]|uniref:glycosyltransferase n=1 Tax=Amaricoccus sp. TaxID=1872485 RepID=UPI0039E65E0A